MKEAIRVRLEAIEKGIDNAISKIVLNSAKKYLKPLKDKSWHNPAVKYLSEFEIVIAEILQAQQEAYAKLIENSKNIYTKQPIQKAKKNYRTHEYLDELHNRVIVDDIKDSLVELESKFEKLLRDSYKKYITDGLIRDSAELVYKDQGMTFDFNKFDESTRDYVKNKQIKWAKEVNQATEEKIKKILTDSFEKGLGSYEVAERIRKSSGFSYKRSEAIARTEIMSACNYTDYIANLNNPYAIGLEWSATMDDRARLTHTRANKQKRKKGEPFIVGGHKILFPGDSSLGAPAREVINCRCTTYSVFEGESLESNTVYDQEGVGTDKWLAAQDKAFQEDYLGGKTKQILFQSGIIGEKDKDAKTEAIIAELKKRAEKNIRTLEAPLPRVIGKEKYYQNLIPAILEVQEKGIKQNREFARVLEYSTGVIAEEDVLKNLITGDERKKQVAIDDKMWDKINESDGRYILIHNHPNSTSFSFADIVAFYRNKGIKAMIVVGHDGSIYYLTGKGVIENLPENENERHEFIKDNMEVIRRDFAISFTLGVDKRRKIVYNKVLEKLIKNMGYMYYYEDFRKEL